MATKRLPVCVRCPFLLFRYYILQGIDPGAAGRPSLLVLVILLFPSIPPTRSSPPFLILPEEQQCSRPGAYEVKCTRSSSPPFLNPFFYFLLARLPVDTRSICVLLLSAL